MEFYRRNYIEGLFLSSAVLGTPDYTTERMLAVLRLLRGANTALGATSTPRPSRAQARNCLQQLGYLADRLSVNVELPSEQSLNLLAPDKGRHSIFRPMKQIAVSGAASFLRDLSDETLYPILRAVRHLNGEVHQYKGFVRFSDLGAYWGRNRAEKPGPAPAAPSLLRPLPERTVLPLRPYPPGGPVLRRGPLCRPAPGALPDGPAG